MIFGFIRRKNYKFADGKTNVHTEQSVVYITDNNPTEDFFDPYLVSSNKTSATPINPNMNYDYSSISTNEELSRLISLQNDLSHG